MEQLAPPGTIRLTADTLRLAEAWVQVTPLGPVPVKGLSAPVEVCELVGAGPARTPLQAFAARGLTLFVGRQAELAALHEALEQAESGHGQVVAVIGEPGVGKTRLFHEFTHASRTQGWLLLESSSTSYGKATSYLPVMGLLKAYFQIEDRDDGRRVREKLTGRLLTLDPTLEPTLPAFLTLLEVPVEDPAWHALDPAQRRQRTLEALKRLLLRESQVQPLLLVFENLHWIDTETQAFLDGLLESLPAARMLLLCNYRPEYQHGWGQKTYYTQRRLDPLPPASAEALLQSLLGDDARLEPLKQRLIARTQGNPFFLEECVRTLVESGGLAGAPGAYRLVHTLPTLHMPATVQTVLAARIDRLPAEDKRLLQTAAVIGTEVPFALLQSIAELPEAAVHRGLAHLQAAEFLYETRLFPEHAYTFRHALTHEVAYGSLLQERRRTLHASIVAALEALYPDRLADQVELLAQHAVRGDVWDKALLYCRQAGARAMARSASREAVTCFEQALAALRQLPENRDTLAQAIDLRLDLRNALVTFGEPDRTFTYLREAETIAEALGDHRRLGWVLARMSRSFHVAGEYGRGLALAQRALTLAISSGDSALEGTANWYLGTVSHQLGDYRQAIDFLGRAVALLAGELRHTRLGQGLTSVLSRAYLTQCLAEVGAFAEGIARGEEGLHIAEAANHAYSLSVACWGVGHLYLHQGDLHHAIALLKRGFGLARVADLSSLVPRIASALGAAYTLAGRSAESLTLLEQTVQQATAIRRLAYHTPAVTHLSEAYLLAGRLSSWT